MPTLVNVDRKRAVNTALTASVSAVESVEVRPNCIVNVTGGEDDKETVDIAETDEGGDKVVESVAAEVVGTVDTVGTFVLEVRRVGKVGGVTTLADKTVTFKRAEESVGKNAVLVNFFCTAEKSAAVVVVLADAEILRIKDESTGVCAATKTLVHADATGNAVNEATRAACSLTERGVDLETT